MVISAAFWKGRRVFLTGHTGFKGAWLALWLQRLGAEVFGYSLPPPSEPSLFVLAEVADGMAGTVTGDIRDGVAMKAAMRRAQPDIVIHLAAQAIASRSYEDPLEMLSTNVVGTATLLEAIRGVDTVRVVISVPSDNGYESREGLPQTAAADVVTAKERGLSQSGAAELAVAAMRAAFFQPGGEVVHGLGVASVRAGYLVGGGDWDEHRLIPELMRALTAGKACIIRAPASIRAWQHVLEPLSGYLCLAEVLWRGDVGYAGCWDFGPHMANARPVSWVCDYISRLWSGGSSSTAEDSPIGSGSRYVRDEIPKAHALLGWAPVWSVETTLEAVVEWYRAYAEHRLMLACTVSQIERFCADLALNAAKYRPTMPAAPALMGPG